ncbi:NADH(P)-binding protein, PF13460 family [Leptospira fainei serovar Hurstbridge str. BUT 6]|uniref:NADH(P)-binding protein, PF13460 family n=1 Tax=Leptospira fainei serovar Hurstbridge str. BUT 6 TaxID=1193011 RepID=S3V696_9LEPT|nr:SDR family oxidoreductase [Leptospira fainei]EPG76184.1 NADH(P)-binding protein, PF13460 family [Leptospira fainei serovar Hurstbridge str. BUT 6]
MKKTAIITGASTGIGYEIAKLAASDGYDLILVARNAKTLAKVKKETESLGAKTDFLALDLSDPKSPKKIYDFAKKKKAIVDLLVNNAGFGTNGRFDTLDLTQELSLIQVNVTSLVALTHLFLKDMVDRHSGKILNVASTAAFQPGPLMTNYYASKAYVLFFSEGISEELKKVGVTVTCLCPGPTNTEFFKRAEMDNSALLNSPMVPKATPHDVAKLGYEAVKNGRAVVISGFANKVLAQSVRITPRFLIRKIAKIFNTVG